MTSALYLLDYLICARTLTPDHFVIHSFLFIYSAFDFRTTTNVKETAETTEQKKMISFWH